MLPPPTISCETVFFNYYNKIILMDNSIYMFQILDNADVLLLFMSL